MINKGSRTTIFIGFPAKEEVLVRSFLNLARSDLPVDVIPMDGGEQANLVVVDSSVNDPPKLVLEARIIAVVDQAPTWRADVHVAR